MNESHWWFYNFLNVSEFVWEDSEDFCRFAAKSENWVVVIPWKAFWKPDHIRISFASDRIEEWAQRVVDFLKLWAKWREFEKIRDLPPRTAQRVLDAISIDSSLPFQDKEHM